MCGTTGVRVGSEIYISLVQGLRGRRVPLMRSISEKRSAPAATENF
ncbi:conserved hypothetical protein [Treponema phagedenis]|uniref:Uncharacterized protein n=1 Tax=Treponema phagedenis TaxID=162 RepID=A0A0B7GXF8_TREPH|nr:hypothetical protein HMPREF9554_00291 [Treponema phagedenis F0421]CEM61326.1 conserved hypothetical protein [Treponema phagedenis]